MTIFKVQRPIIHNDPQKRWLLSTKSGRQIYIPQALIPEKLSRMMGDKPKMFIDSNLTVTEGIMRVTKIKRAMWRDW
jgi:hypothetical protein